MKPVYTAALPTAAPPALHRGWVMVLVAIVGLCLSVGSVLVYTFGILAKPLGSAFAANRGSMALAVTFLNLMVAFSSPITGRLADRFGPKRVIMVSLAGLAGCLFLLSRATPPVWHLWVLYALAGLAGAGSTPVAYARVVTNWFDRNRGLALGVASTGIGLGGLIMPVLTQRLVETVGWQQTYLLFGGGCLFIALPVVALLLKNRPEDVGLRVDGGAVAGPAAAVAPAAGLTLPEALRTRTFWMLCLVFFGIAASGLGALAHLASMLTDQGFTPQKAALATSLFGAATIVGRVGNGVLVDRYFAPRVAAVAFAGAAIGLGLLWGGGTGAVVFVAAVLIGLAIGAESDIMPYIVSRYFGVRAMGALYGIIFGAYTIGAAAGPYLFGAGFDWTGSYRLPFACAGGISLLAAAGILTLGNYPTAHRNAES